MSVQNICIFAIVKHKNSLNITVMTKIDLKNTINQWKKDAVDLGTSMTAICKRAGVTPVTLHNWEKSEPNTVILINKIHEAIAAMKKEAV